MAGDAAPRTTEALTFGEPAGRWVLAATVLGSSLAFLDATVVNIALPAIGRELGSGVVGLTWTVNGYALTLAAFVLLGGSLGDRFGRRRVFLVGVAWFGVASLACALATGVGMLVVSRALQGVGGALLTPGALAILHAAFRPEDRSRAIGAWSGLAGIAGAVGPFLGGWLVGVGSWRWIFLINLPVVVAVLAIAARHVPESRDVAASGRIDVAGAALAVLGLGSLTYGLSVWPLQGSDSATAQVAVGLGLLGLFGFVVRERTAADPMLPLDVFAAPRFGATNLVTFLVYAALGGVFFWLVVTLQVVADWDALQAGLALLPITLLMLVFSARAGVLGDRLGPRIPMTAGPLLAAVGVAALSRVGPGASYLPDVAVSRHRPGSWAHPDRDTTDRHRPRVGPRVAVRSGQRRQQRRGQDRRTAPRGSPARADRTARRRLRGPRRPGTGVPHGDDRLRGAARGRGRDLGAVDPARTSASGGGAGGFVSATPLRRRRAAGRCIPPLPALAPRPQRGEMSPSRSRASPGVRRMSYGPDHQVVASWKELTSAAEG